MAIRLSGMISGMDTDALVQELVSAYSTKKDKYVKQKTQLEWTQEKWKALNTKTYSFYTGKLSNMRFSNSYSKKAVSVSDTTKATVSASSGAVNGTQNLKVKQLATTGYLTGAELKNASGKKASHTGTTKLSELGVTGSGSISVKVDGKEHTFEVGADTTINNVVSQLKTAGLNASFDENNQRFFISSKTSGAEHDFALTGDSNGIEALKNMGVFSLSRSEEQYYKELANQSDDDLKAKVSNEYLQSMLNTVKTSVTAENKKLKAEHDYLKDYEKIDQKLQESIQKNTDDLNKKLKADDLSDAYTDEQKYQILSQVKAGSITAENYKDMATLTEDDKKYLDAYYKLSESDKKTVLSYADKNAGYLDTQKIYDGYKAELMDGATVSADKVTARIGELQTKMTDNTSRLESYDALANKTYTAENVGEFEGDVAALEAEYKTITGENSGATTKEYAAIQKKYEDIRAEAKKIIQNGATNLSTVSRIEGQDSKIELNGAEFTSNTNNYSINGLTITAMGVTAEDESITITTSTDVDGIYNMVKDFFKSYNEVMKEMQTAYNAESAKGYEPLTDEEKEAMSDEEVEKWETKIKDALLRRDDTLGGIINAMQTAMSKGVTVNGKNYTLSTFGIGTGNYFSTDANERGCYHIDGDPDDETTSGNADKLKAAIAQDPDTFVEAFSQISKNLYDTLTKKMARTSLSSSYTIYNDKYMDTQKTQLEKTISEWEDRVTAYEDKYYKQFSEMETALSKLQSSSSYLSGLLGS